MLRIFTSRRCLEHRPPGRYPERPDRLRAILDPLGPGGSAPLDVEEVDSPAGADPPGPVLAVHDEDYIRRLREAVERGDGLIDSADNPLSPGTWDAAVASVEAVLAATRWAAGGGGRHAFAAVRPPGHHAERGRAMGFCYFSNAVVAALDLLEGEAGASGERPRKVAVVDFDVHHGNGTQHLTEDRPDVFYASLHQWPFYPGTGARTERGVGEGEGTVVNVPLPAGTPGEEFLEAMDREVLPALERFGPEFLVVSAGFDAWQNDPLGGMLLDEDAFRRIGRRMGAIAAACGDRSVSLLEGGYDVEALPRLVRVYLEGLDSGGAPGGGP